MGESLDSVGPRSGGISEVEEELQIHLELLVEQLCDEGYERSAAKAEARRRFGDFEALAEECVALRAGVIGVVLRWLITSNVGAWAVGAAGVFLVVMIGSPIFSFLFLLMPITLLAGVCALVAGTGIDGHGLSVRAGQRLLGLLLLLTVSTFFVSDGDWVHSLWSVQFGLYGLLFASGLVLIRVWPEDRRSARQLRRRWSAPTVALISVLVLGALPMLLSVPSYFLSSADQEGGSLVSLLLEVANYGFGGERPGSMLPHGGREMARGLGIPPRIVTVTMGASWLAAVHWLLFVGLAFAGRAIRDAGLRRTFYLVTPMLLGVSLVAFTVFSKALDHGIWKNEPWLVASYGPVLLFAVLATVALFLALRRAGEDPGRGAASPTSMVQ